MIHDPCILGWALCSIGSFRRPCPPFSNQIHSREEILYWRLQLWHSQCSRFILQWKSFVWIGAWKQNYSWHIIRFLLIRLYIFCFMCRRLVKQKMTYFLSTLWFLISESFITVISLTFSFNLHNLNVSFIAPLLGCHQWRSLGRKKLPPFC